MLPLMLPVNPSSYMLTIPYTDLHRSTSPPSLPLPAEHLVSKVVHSRMLAVTLGVFLVHNRVCDGERFIPPS